MKRRQTNKPSVYNSLVKIWPLMRLVIGFVALCVVVVLAFKSVKDSRVNIEAYASEGEVYGVYTSATGDEDLEIVSPTGVEFVLEAPNEEEIAEAQVKYEEKLRKIQEEQRRKEEARRRERMEKATALQAYLQKMGSPMAPYAELILDSCEQYGTHYCKFFLSIAGVESGFGRIPIGCCNAWGIISTHWTSWNISIPSASDWLANNYYLRGVNTFEKLAYSSYGPQNPQKWISDLYTFYNQIPL